MNRERKLLHTCVPPMESNFGFFVPMRKKCENKLKETRNLKHVPKLRPQPRKQRKEAFERLWV